MGDPRPWNVRLVSFMPRCLWTELVSHGPAAVWLLIDPAWPVDREDLPPFGHEPEQWPSEDPKLKNDTGPPNVLIMPVSVNPVIRNYRCCPMAHGIRDSDIPSIIRSSYSLVHPVVYGPAPELRHITRNLKPALD